MQLVQTASQKAIMTMSGQMLSSIAILGMSTQDLSEHLKEKAATNPAVSYRPPRFLGSGGGEGFDAVAALASDKPSLMAHVVAQIELAFAAPADRVLALRFAESLEPTGWLSQPLATIAALAGVAEARAAALLDRLQQFEPTGLFARSLAECLKLQAREADQLTWELEALLDNLPLLAEGRTRELAELCDCDPEDIPEIARQLRGFDPKPGLAFAHEPTPIFPPDLTATRTDQGWSVELNRAATPEITVSPDRLPGGTADPQARAFRRKALAEARALAQALERRGDTLLRTAAVLVARQSEFMLKGPGHLVPLSLEDVAEELELNPSTISRATSGRMIQTPNGALPLRAFFSRSMSSASGGAVSQDALRDFVRRTIETEDPARPLSDDAIVTLARKADLAIARRTVAKYRSSLGIASSYQRRRNPDGRRSAAF
ncbi:RNA polymerase factor sigma-54 [Tropicimonas sp. IMCC34043]|uniref:RNA polymerase factor sigma-54 n=1 Tax=Tropicimonas sp. IMCC34043 TaxID=2248760 RepID=UPI000E23F488|nr:RNA polymerase factor sigma-54 [Tropicimonas sp. IMCC34043]